MRILKFFAIIFLALTAVALTLLAVMGHKAGYYNLGYIKSVIFLIIGVVLLIWTFKIDWNITFSKKKNNV